MAGYLLHRVLQDLTKNIASKHTTVEKTPLLHKKGWIEEFLMADRDVALQSDYVDEIEFFQNEHYALKHVSTSFFEIVKHIDQLWFSQFRPGTPSSITDVKDKLLTSGVLTAMFFDIGGNLPPAERQGKSHERVQPNDINNIHTIYQANYNVCTIFTLPCYLEI